ncbi:arginine--tRNA ligase [Spirulina subsalsa FACHB-351]|uniref:Arginine--tRNA ligase n=1 Tax=Spirulina subsalsa FACHB-351 TaxID=234711 RepID=A0ABT3L5H5_9CYAN|nr:arginine--tRNA ligase [Spirulina subsalsa]MCW6036447.1 arginine--tRNA ligase [Spirulina subsalsa FACHB-351]
MTSILEQLKTQFTQALVAAFGEEMVTQDPLIAPTNNPKFGDYQCNVALSLAKPLKQKPRDIAQTLINHLQLQEMCEPPEIAGPGFINLTLKPQYLAQHLTTLQQDPRLGVETAKHPQKVIVDFSSPNIAKEMHVGHLRSTIIGDSIARILEFRGHDVLRLNHVGDWGTQFGMLIAYLREAYPEALTTANALDLGDLVSLYRQAKQRFDEDEDFRETARQEVVNLQAGAEDSRHAWQLLCNQSRKEFQAIYDALDIKLQERGESFYNPLLPGVVETLDNSGILAEDQGAKCVFLDGFSNKEGNPLPLIVQKSDGGYNYATTDLAALQYRIRQDEAERIIYVTDAGQANHFTQVFQVAKKAGILPEQVDVVHVPFGLVQGEDGKKLKTRSGETVRLRDLLDEAVDRAYQDVEQRLQTENRQEDEDFKHHVAQVIGLSAVKYADLSQNRTSNYVFSYNKMLALQGNTSPYLLYAYVRIQGISRKGNIDFSQLSAIGKISKPLTQLNWKPLLWAFFALLVGFLGIDITVRIYRELHSIPLLPSVFQLTGFFYTLWFIYNRLLFQKDRKKLWQDIQETKETVLGEPQPPALPVVALPPEPTPGGIVLAAEAELNLAKHLLQLSDILQEVERDLLPNRLCQYLYELSQKFNQFFEQCPVLKAEEPVRTSRLMLCNLTAETLKLGLSLLGIPVLERM